MQKDQANPNSGENDVDRTESLKDLDKADRQPVSSTDVQCEDSCARESLGKDVKDGDVVQVETGNETEDDDTRQDKDKVDLEALTHVSTRTPVHSVFTKNEKRFIVCMTAWAGLFSPMSMNIYYPALNSLARDLHVTDSLINLTLTSYMIFQGLAPTFFGDLADSAGRRPAYIIGFMIYLVANIGLALQDSYAALFVLRCFQSMGSSSVIALAQGVVADICTSAERGSYVGYVTAGMMLGPSLGPVIGGILGQFLGWRSIFWFLAIFCTVMLIPFVIFFPETSRNVVGNGSIPPQGWNMSLINYLEYRKAAKEPDTDISRTTSQEQRRMARQSTNQKRKIKWPNPLHVVKIIREKEVGILLAYNSIIYIAFVDIAASLASILKENYGFNDLKIGLSFLPFGVGCSCAAFVNGQILDRNYTRIAKNLGFSTSKKRQIDLRHFPIEKARLQLAIPMLYTGAGIILAYGWVLDQKVHFAAPLTLLFGLGYFVVGSFNALSTLLVDLNPKSPATATAANNLVRCLVGSGATALIVPMINGMGQGWAFTLISAMLVATSPMMMVLWKYGPKWREEKRVKMEVAEKEKEAREAERLQVESHDTHDVEAVEVGKEKAAQ